MIFVISCQFVTYSIIRMEERGKISDKVKAFRFLCQVSCLKPNLGICIVGEHKLIESSIVIWTPVALELDDGIDDEQQGGLVGRMTKPSFPCTVIANCSTLHSSFFLSLSLSLSLYRSLSAESFKSPDDRATQWRCRQSDLGHATAAAARALSAGSCATPNRMTEGGARGRERERERERERWLNGDGNVTGHYTGINICDGDRRAGTRAGGRGGEERGERQRQRQRRNRIENRCQNGETSILPSIHWYVPWAGGAPQLRAKQDYIFSVRTTHHLSPRIEVGDKTKLDLSPWVVVGDWLTGLRIALSVIWCVMTLAWYDGCESNLPPPPTPPLSPFNYSRQSWPHYGADAAAEVANRKSTACLNQI